MTGDAEASEGNSLAGNDAIARAFELHNRYVSQVDHWNHIQSQKGIQILLWNITENLLVQSRTSKWQNQSGLPTNDELRTALNIQGNDNIETILEREDGNSESRFVKQGRALDTQRRKVEERANDLRNYILYGSADIESAADAMAFHEQPFFAAFRNLDFNNQLRVACRITSGLSQSRVGKQLLTDLLFELPFRFLDFFHYPADDDVGFPAEPGSSSETEIKPLAERYVQSDDRGKLEKEFSPVVDNLLMLAGQTLPGVTYRVVHNPTSSPAREEAMQAFGTILYLFFDSDNVFDGDEVDQYFSSTSHDAVLSDLKSGGIPWSEVGGLVPAFVGKGEKIVGTINGETGWNGDVPASRLVAVKGLLAGWGAGVHAMETVDKIQNDNYDGWDFAENLHVFVKTMLDTTIAKRIVDSIGKNSRALGKKILGVIGIITNLVDMVINFYKARQAYDRNDLSVAIGFGIAGLGTLGGVATGMAYILGGLKGVGFVVAVIASAVVGLGGTIFATLTADSPVLTWVRRSIYGTLYGDDTSPDPTKFYYDYPSNNAEQAASARMAGRYFSFQTDVAVNSVEVYDRHDAPEPSHLQVTLDNVVLASPTDVVIRPIVNKGNGDYETGQLQHVLHMADAKMLTNTEHHDNPQAPPPLDTNLKSVNTDEPIDTSPSWELNVWEDQSASSFSIRDLVGIERSMLDTRSGHYLEIGIVPSSLKDSTSDSLGTQIRANTFEQYSKAYDRIPIMVRDRKEISL